MTTGQGLDLAEVITADWHRMCDALELLRRTINGPHSAGRMTLIRYEHARLHNSIGELRETLEDEGLLVLDN